ncbi:MAG: EAL domain-containing protein [Spirochaetia bacterium]|nr:EAL domain-containing protein [Spirochaetia bacterium]
MNELKIEDKLRLYASAFENALECMMITDDTRRVIAVNPAFERITGFSPAEVTGKRPSFLDSKTHNMSFYRTIWRAVRVNGSWQGEIQSRRKTGEIYSEWLSITALTRGGALHYLAVFTDITHRKEYESTLYALANYDPLTGLANRNLFNERIELAIKRAAHSRQKLALLILDMDRFKSVRMTLGQATADQLLLAAVTRIKKCLGPNETLARLGGDEFAIIAENVHDATDAVRIARDVLSTMSRVFLSKEYERYLTCSIGISVYPDDCVDANFLQKNADTATYRAKLRGRNNFQMYGPDMHVATFEQLLLENNLRSAISNGEFCLFYQPIVDAETGKLARMESLIRWNHPELGLIPPDVFIRSAEESGLIYKIGEWVIREACQQFQTWKANGIDLPVVSVNVSAVQLRKMNLFSIVASAIRDNRLKPGELELEITESSAMQNSDASFGFLKDLGSLGVGLSIDDFGVGYSSLAYLKRLPIHRLKIDRSFVRDLPEDSDSKAIAAAIIAMAHSLELGVIAEGVESLPQLNYLRSINCDEVQGFYFAQPMPPNEVDFARYQ